MTKNIAKSAMCCGAFLLLFCFTLAQGSDICYFNGLVQDPSQWETDEFTLLLGDDTAPGYLIITRVIGKIAAATNINDLTSPSCEIFQYVEALIKYYDENKVTIREKHEEIADLLDFIKNKINK